MNSTCRNITAPRVILKFFALLISAHIFCFSAAIVFADGVDVTGDWSGTTVVNGEIQPYIFYLKQTGSVVTGSQITNNQACQISGSIENTLLTFQTDCPTLSYSWEAVAYTDGLIMSGGFVDSQGTSGTFNAQKSSPVLTPGTQLSDPPRIEIRGDTVVFTLNKFLKVSMTKSNRQVSVAKSPSLTLMYEVKIRGTEVRQLTSKKNILALKNLKPGSYTSTYRVIAFKNGKRAFATNSSPAASFTLD